MRTSAYILLPAGLALFTLLIGYHGFGDVVAALALSGWGLVWVALYHLAPLVLDATAWRKLFEIEERPSLHSILWARWIGESVNSLLPVAQVGGDLVKARLIANHDLPGPVAGASVVVDLTLSVLTQIVFTCMGLFLLVGIGERELTTAILIALGFMGLLVTCFYLVQRRGLFSWIVSALRSLSSKRDWQQLLGGAAELDHAIAQIYRNRRGLLAAAVRHLLAWIVGAGEVCLAMYFLDSPVTIWDALLLESLGEAVRSAAFLIPGALGVQEGGYLILGSLLGFTPEVALALSLTKRVRVLLLGLPGLLSWQIAEGRKLWRRRSETTRDPISRLTD